MDDFYESTFKNYEWESISNAIYNSPISNITTVLNSRQNLLWSQAISLISPKAVEYLDLMASKAQQLTRQRFGNTIQLFTPLYLSNECQNICTYCGFSFTNKLPRKTLNPTEIKSEAYLLKEMGFQHILLVTGEHKQLVGIDYLCDAVAILKPYFINLSIEVQPLSTEEYLRLQSMGTFAVIVYQETYRQSTYQYYHPKGNKSNFIYRINTPDRAGKAHFHKIGIGALLGLEDWRIEAAYIMMHLDYLKKKYWKTRFSVSFPRLRPFEGDYDVKHPVSDTDLLQMIAALRIYDPNIELVLSTREQASFRDKLLHLGITTMSAGSKTNPGGYGVSDNSLEQFSIDDDRSASEVANSIKNAGLQPIWKDWETFV